MVAVVRCGAVRCGTVRCKNALVSCDQEPEERDQEREKET
jgi:hypothetical protein